MENIADAYIAIDKNVSSVLLNIFITTTTTKNYYYGYCYWCTGLMAYKHVISAKM